MISRTALGSLLSLAILFPAAAAGAPVRVSGWVFLPDGRAAGDTAVELVADGGDRAAQLDRLAGRAAAAGKVAPDGRFELSAPPGLYRLRFTLAGFVPAELAAAPLVEDTDFPPVILSAARPLALRLLEAAGRPLGGVTVRSWGEPGRPTGSAPSPAPRQAVADAEGRLTLPMAPGELVALRVSGPTVDERITMSQPARGELALRVPLRAPAVFEVRGRDGKPVAGAVLSLGGSLPLGVTDAAGRLAVPVPSGEAKLVALGPGGERASQPLAAPRGQAPVVLRLAPPRTVAGRVVDGAGKPVAGAFVFSSLGATSAGADGGFRLPVAFDEGSPVRAAAPGYRDAESGFDPAIGGSLELTLRAAARLAGRAVDGEGHPLPGVRIEARCAASGARLPTSVTSSRPDGTFRLGGLEPGASCLLMARGRGKVSAVKRVTTPAASLVLTLAGGLAASGRILGPNDQPVEQAEIALEPEEGVAGERAAPVVALSGADGRFDIAPLSPGAFRALIRHPAFLPFERRAVTVAAPPAGQAPAAVDLGTFRLDPGAALTGLVVDAKGAPLAGARVTAYSLAQGDGREAASGADGQFRLEGLARGEELVLSAERPGYSPARRRVSIPSPGAIRLELSPARFLSGTVTGPRAEPIAGARLSASTRRSIRREHESSSEGWSSDLGVTDDEGRFRVPAPEPGTLDLDISARGYRAHRERGVAVPAEGDLEGLAFHLERGVALSGRVFDGETPAAAAEVGVTPDHHMAPFDSTSQPPQYWEARTDGEGRYRVEGMGLGPHWVTATARDGRIAEARVTLGELGGALDLRFPRTEITGRLLAEGGIPSRAPSSSWSRAETARPGRPRRIRAALSASPGSRMGPTTSGRWPRASPRRRSRSPSRWPAARWAGSRSACAGRP